MKNLKSWKKFNESGVPIGHTTFHGILNEIADRIGRSRLTDVGISYGLTPYMYFVFNGTPFSISLIDHDGSNTHEKKPTYGFKTINVIAEDADGSTNQIASFDVSDIDSVVDSILDYERK